MARMTRKEMLRWLREMGGLDARNGNPIEAYYKLPLKGRHTEDYRAEYEVGYRAAKDEMRKAAGKARRREEQQ